MNREVKIKTTMLSLLITLCYGACTHLETDLKDFMTHRIVIPYDSITRFSDSLFKNNFSTFNLINKKSRVPKQTLLLHEYIR